MTFDEMKKLNPENVDRDTLVDIASVEVDSTLPKEACPFFDGTKRTFSI